MQPDRSARIPRHIVIFDTTLRDGEQAPGAAMTLPDKVRIAHQLARLGVDVIEAGFPTSSPAQFDAVQRIATEVQGPVICALARATRGDIEAAGKALRTGRRTRIHTFIATSDIHLESKFGDERYGRTIDEKRQTILHMAVEAVRQARSFTADVEFSAEDAGRTELPFLCDVIQAVVEAGATTINLPDTTGYCVPEEYAAMFRRVQECCEIGPGVVLSAHCHDDLGLAVANSMAAVAAGAGQIECTINGIGERAGNAALEEVVMGLRVRENYYGCVTALQPGLLMETSRMVSTCSGFPVQPNKAIVGRNAFSHEAGIHQDGVLKCRETYEIMRAEDVGQEVESIRLGRHSGRHGLFKRLDGMGITVPGDQKEDVYRRFLALADRKKEVHDADLSMLFEGAIQVESRPVFSIEKLNLAVGTGHEPHAFVAVRHHRSGVLKEATGTGDGPVDALFRAIDHAVDEAHELVNYAIRSVSEGSDAQGEVAVVLRYGTPCFTGRASHTDVLQASADAYIAALNQLATYREDEASIQFVGNGIMQAFGGE